MRRATSVAAPRIGRPRGPSVRLLRAAVLGAWAAFFVYLGVSGEMSRYLGPRTYWVVPFGAVTLGLASLVHLATLRGAPRTSPSRGDLAGVASLLVPIVAVAAVPAPDLGALAAARKSTGSAVGAAGFITPPAPEAGREPSFIDIHFAGESAEYAATIGIAEGREVTLVGFVSAERSSAGAFELTRFYVSCCAADAIPYSVRVHGGPDRQPLNSWLRVTGALTQTESGWELVAGGIEPVEEPENPYLY